MPPNKSPQQFLDECVPLKYKVMSMNTLKCLNKLKLDFADGRLVQEGYFTPEQYDFFKSARGCLLTSVVAIYTNPYMACEQRQQEQEQAKSFCSTPEAVEVAQVGGTHYQTTIQHWDFVAANDMGYFEGQATKYLTRWKKKGGMEDLLKAKSYVDKLIAIETAKGTK